MEPAVTIELSREQILQRIEDGARRRRNLSAAELLRAYRAGRLDDPGGVADLLILADLLSDDDPVFDGR